MTAKTVAITSVAAVAVAVAIAAVAIAVIEHTDLAHLRCACGLGCNGKLAHRPVPGPGFVFEGQYARGRLALDRTAIPGLGVWCRGRRGALVYGRPRHANARCIGAAVRAGAGGADAAVGIRTPQSKLVQSQALNANITLNIHLLIKTILAVIVHTCAHCTHRAEPATYVIIRKPTRK